MQQFSKFSVYTPQDAGRLALSAEYGVMFLKNIDGQDWYDCRHLFARDTLKIGYDDTGRVATFTMDVDALMPVDLAVAEVPATVDNMRISLGADWFYVDGGLVQKIDYIAQAETERARRLTALGERINWLTTAAEDGDITDDEAGELVQLRAARVALRRMDLSSAPVIVWPEVPGVA
jgi:hypothetical protein